MAHDIVIRGGTVVDGTGSAAFTGDVAIDGGRIVSVGGKAGPGRQEVDADGLVVTPGFVDIHTHLDAQIGWDPLLTPVSWHGVTTALLGNCGVTFAPCKPADRPLLAAMMETVEDIPREAILGGLSWEWESYGEYLDALDKLNPAINVAGMVGHSALRWYVMGERSVEGESTPEEKAEMARIIGQAMDDGAVGFSSNRFPGHVGPDGRSIPGTFADHDEVVAIGHAVAARDGLMQNVVDFGRKDMASGALLRRLAAECRARVLFSYTVGGSPDSGRRNAEYLERLSEGGLDITALSLPRGTGFVFGLQSRIPAKNIWSQRGFFGPAWEALGAGDLEARLAMLRNTETRAALVAEAKAVDPSRLPWVEGAYWMGASETPNYLEPAANSLGAMARNAGEHWSETFFRLSLESGGRGLFTWRMFSANIEAVRDFLPHPQVMPGLSDAGAHVSQVMDCGVTSFILSHWVRDEGLFTLEEGVRKLTSGPARVIGLKDRGVLAPGMRADINVLDLAAIGEKYPRVVRDFPGGVPRYVQGSTGYHATFVNGELAFRDGEHAGGRSGRVLRGARARVAA
ncbi:MAG: amidohydrolase family protein [Phenylobacterium sp.]|uniref:N-acyl-D-amino-acid deacylase family protein n=1 Tax=Phenylobacterium sp. TaxID=1871053 RepID=UPI00301B225E